MTDQRDPIERLAGERNKLTILVAALHHIALEEIREIGERASSPQALAGGAFTVDQLNRLAHWGALAAAAIALRDLGRYDPPQIEKLAILLQDWPAWALQDRAGGPII